MKLPELTTEGRMVLQDTVSFLRTENWMADPTSFARFPDRRRAFISRGNVDDLIDCGVRFCAWGAMNACAYRRFTIPAGEPLDRDPAHYHYSNAKLYVDEYVRLRYSEDPRAAVVMQSAPDSEMRDYSLAFYSDFVARDVTEVIRVITDALAADPNNYPIPRESREVLPSLVS